MMPAFIIYESLYKQLLLKLDMGFEVKLRAKTDNGDVMFKCDKTFMYANIPNIISVSNNHDLKPLSFREINGKYFKAHSYKKEYIQISIAVILQNVLSKYINAYANSFVGIDNSITIRNLDILYANEIGISKDIIHTYDRSFIPNPFELDFIKYLYNSQAFFPVGDVYFSNALKDLRHILKKGKGYFKFHKKYAVYNYYAIPNMDDSFMRNGDKPFLSVLNTALDKAYEEATIFLKGLLL